MKIEEFIHEYESMVGIKRRAYKKRPCIRVKTMSSGI